MRAYTEELHKELKSKLEDCDKTHDPQNLFDPRPGLITNSLDLIREKLKIYQFESIEEEIHYFKYTLPPTLAIYYYYMEKIEWDRIISQGSPECKFRFVDRLYTQIDDARREHRMFREYYRDGATSLDNFYFLRNSPVNRERKYQALRTIDASSPPMYCEILAMLIAHTKIEFDLRMSELKNTPNVNSVTPDDGGVSWTGTKVSGSELVYALKHSGLINHGMVSLQKVQACFEKGFSVDLGNITKRFQDIQQRKVGIPSVIDTLKEGLTRFHKDLDQEYDRKRKSNSGSPGSDK
jgi:hypothetical protein